MRVKGSGIILAISAMILSSCSVERAPASNTFTPIYKGTWNLINDTTTSIENGDIITIAAPNKNVTAGSLSDDKSSLFATSSTFESNYSLISSLSEKALQLKITRVGDVFKLSNSEGQYLGVESDRSLSWDSGVLTWDIYINKNTNYNANICSTNSDLGQLMFNTSAAINAFKMYTVTTGKALEYPKIYKGTSPNPIYVTSVSVVGQSDLYIGQSTYFSITYSPTEANRLNTVWSSSNKNVLTVNSAGLVTAISEGSATVSATLPGENGTSVTGSLDITVRRVSVTGVKISDSAKTVRPNKTFTLGAEVSPSNATNKSITWHSSNTSVATVSQSGVVKGVSEGTSVISVVTADGGFTDTCTVTVANVALDEWTIMIYMCGADLESDSGLATSDLKEILSVAGQPDDVNIIVETGGARSWKSTYGISAKYLERWHVKNKSLVKDTSLTKASMGLTSTFQSFLEWGLTEYPAEKTGVIMWNHGGAMTGVCFDENYSDNSLTNDEVKSAVSGAFNNLGRDDKLEFIGYDACLMQVQDVAEFNSQYFNYMIASEESESGYGWDYDTWVDDLYGNQPTETILKAIVDGFIADNGGASKSSSDQTLSFLDLSKMDNYRTKWEALAGALKSKINSSKASSFRTLVNSAQSYAGSDYQYYCIYDAKDFLNKLNSNSTFNPGGSYISDCLSAFSSLVKYSVAQKGAGNSYGLCMFFATSSKASKSKYYKTSMTNFTNWQYLVENYGA